MQSSERGAAPLTLPDRMIVASVVGAVVLLLMMMVVVVMMMVVAVRRAHGGPETRVRHSGIGVLKVADVEAVMMLLQEAVVGDRRHPAVGMRHRLLVTFGDFADRPVRGGTSGREGRHHRRMMMPVEGWKAERIWQSHGTISRWLTLSSESVRDVSRLLVAVAITIVSRLPLIILPGFALNLDAGLRGLGHLDFNPHVVPVRDRLALDRETGRRSRRRTRRAGVLVAATHAALLHPRGFTRRRRDGVPRPASSSRRES